MTVSSSTLMTVLSSTLTSLIKIKICKKPQKNSPEPAGAPTSVHVTWSCDDEASLELPTPAVEYRNQRIIYVSIVFLKFKSFMIYL